MANFPEILADRYRQFKFRHFTTHREYYEKLANVGQSPKVMVISCSDSRVDPEAIFNCLPGELFVVRNVANLVPPFETDGTYHGVSAALEFAVLNLHVKNIIVLGHSGCGGIRACLEQHSARQSEARFITNWMSLLDKARERVLECTPGHAVDQQRARLEHEGIRTSLANLRTFSYIHELEQQGQLALYGAHFDIGSGELQVFDEAAGGFKVL